MDLIGIFGFFEEYGEVLLVAIIVFFCVAYIGLGLLAAMKAKGSAVGFWTTFFTVVAGILLYITLAAYFSILITSLVGIFIAFLVTSFCFLYIQFELFRNFLSWLTGSLSALVFGGSA